MSAEEMEDKPVITGRKTPEEKSAEHLQRIQRSLVACVMGIVTGTISFLAIDPANTLGLQSHTLLALVIMVAGVVVQRHIFQAMRLGPASLGKKDWFYQGFMTFAFWFITWTLLLTGTLS
ncbi:MAG TPA: hypothetical protein PLN56_02275 [Methanoregulaceae archaeon]|nr:MAG: hypothetical protein IPI71_02155 [Methanolinea sp.]HON81322.1 hypothetical protein [Methanoregulaceae archaeon]HPD09814.1 hypothetical protein [Methanoregulaceae archaeon]HRT14465.1 hypothetical protein [Methanoregulaceae archaeon]HRU30036.1 hypothetical protein [Methanoregulaceae archaeon]